MQLTGTKKIMGGLALAGTLMLTGVVGFAQQETPQAAKSTAAGMVAARDAAA